MVFGSLIEGFLFVVAGSLWGIKSEGYLMWTAGQFAYPIVDGSLSFEWAFSDDRLESLSPFS